MIGIKHQHMPLWPQPRETRADRQVGGDVKGLAGVLGDDPVERGLRVVLTTQVDMGQGVGLRRAHLEMRAATGKAQAQRVVPRDHRIPRRLQRIRVQVTVKRERTAFDQGDGMGIAQLMVHPDFALAFGQRDLLPVG